MQLSRGFRSTLQGNSWDDEWVREIRDDGGVDGWVHQDDVGVDTDADADAHWTRVWITNLQFVHVVLSTNIRKKGVIMSNNNE